MTMESFKLEGRGGMQASICNYGARLTSLQVPASCGTESGLLDVVLGYNREQDYQRDTMYLGAVVGRYSNRIGGARFSLGDSEYQLLANEGSNHLHGGPSGFDSRTWELREHAADHLCLALHSAAGDQGYPGNLEVEVTYRLLEDNTLQFTWRARSDADTLVSLSQHSYFNLAGGGLIYDHYLSIPADQYLPVDVEMIPTGVLASVANTAFDLRSWRRLGDLLQDLPAELEATGGLDHNWVLPAGEDPVAAQVYCPESELLLQVRTTLPGLQCYTGNALGRAPVYASHEGFCLETQHFPDAPNQLAFPCPLLPAGEWVEHRSSYRFAECSPAELPGFEEFV